MSQSKPGVPRGFWRDVLDFALQSIVMLGLGFPLVFFIHYLLTGSIK